MESTCSWFSAVKVTVIETKFPLLLACSRTSFSLSKAACCAMTLSTRSRKSACFRPSALIGNSVGEVRTNNLTGLGDGLEKLHQATEIGWRLNKGAWGKGYATEAGLKALDFAFGHLHSEEVVAITTLTNTRSRAVMDRLGMLNTNENFMHPQIQNGSSLREHVLYRLTQDAWRENGG